MKWNPVTKIPEETKITIITIITKITITITIDLLLTLTLQWQTAVLPKFLVSDGPPVSTSLMQQVVAVICNATGYYCYCSDL